MGATQLGSPERGLNWEVVGRGHTVPPVCTVTLGRPSLAGTSSVSGMTFLCCLDRRATPQFPAGLGTPGPWFIQRGALVYVPGAPHSCGRWGLWQEQHTALLLGLSVCEGTRVMSAATPAAERLLAILCTCCRPGSVEPHGAR